MIDTNAFFTEIKNNLALLCPDGLDSSDLIHIAESVLEKDIGTISVAPEHVDRLWAWLETSFTQIIARFVPEFSKDMDISDLSKQINSVFKKGASGAQVFIDVSRLPDLVSNLGSVRDDLFFNKTISIGLNMGDVMPNAWGDVFTCVGSLRADALVLGFSGQSDKSSDFVGLVYGLINDLPDNMYPELHFMLGNDVSRIEQVWRLFSQLRPDFLQKLKFFVNR